MYNEYHAVTLGKHLSANLATHVLYIILTFLSLIDKQCIGPIAWVDWVKTKDFEQNPNSGYTGELGFNQAWVAI